MSAHRILRLKPALRLERRDQHGQNKANQRDHHASLADSVARKIRIRFSVHTGRRISYPALLWPGTQYVMGEMTKGSIAVGRKIGKHSVQKGQICEGLEEPQWRGNTAPGL